MRIIPEGIKPHDENIVGIGDYPHFDVDDTIEITDAEWDAIFKEFGHWFYKHQDGTPSQYLRELISLQMRG
jgi:hypothetical protein